MPSSKRLKIKRANSGSDNESEIENEAQARVARERNISNLKKRITALSDEAQKEFLRALRKKVGIEGKIEDIRSLAELMEGKMKDMRKKEERRERGNVESDEESGPAVADWKVSTVRPRPLSLKSIPNWKRQPY